MRSREQTSALFERLRPTYVVHLAARVGGLFANMKDKVGFYEDNMQINLNVLHSSHKQGVKRVLSALSTCIFPDGIGSLMTEADIHKGAPHPSNEGYAYAKRMLEMHSRLYGEQHNLDFRCFVPTNLYGPHDQYNEGSHVVADLIQKAHKAHSDNDVLTVMGTGKALR